MFSMNDVKEMEEGGPFHFNVTLSMIHSNGTLDVPVTKGIYYFFFIMDSSKEFENDDYGWISMYWGSREDGS
jgi:hypothetical protein